MDEADKKGRDTLIVLKRLRDASLLAKGGYSTYEFQKPQDDNELSIQSQLAILSQLHAIGAITGEYMFEPHSAGNEIFSIRDLPTAERNGSSEKYMRFKVIEPRFSEACNEYSAYEDEIAGADTEIFRVSLDDRDIRVNDTLLSRPHPTGGNLLFFEYAYNNPGIEIKKTDLPEQMQKDLRGKDFTKILNELGFKGEILPTFFPKRSKSSALFLRRVTTKGWSAKKLAAFKKDLENARPNDNPE